MSFAEATMTGDSLREDLRSVTIPVTQVSQPIGDFFIGVMARQIAVDISEFDIRRLVERERFTDFLGIQREVSEKRVKDIVRYLGTTDATFPTAVILSVKEECAELHRSGLKNSTVMHLKLSNYPHTDLSKRILFKQIATVIDGQHRLEALRRITSPFDVNVAIFVG